MNVFHNRRGRVEPGAGQESVWDYPRPPHVEASERHVQVVFAGLVIADTHRAKRVLETSHPPVYYIPPEDVRVDCLGASARRSWCEWKGEARYYSVVTPDATAPDAAWTYLEPRPRFAAIRGHVAFYPGQMEACYVDGERVLSQPGDFYGGWITADVVGPFKGGPGTMGW
jgi:uncharacterized protein (DUF427 family)